MKFNKVTTINEIKIWRKKNNGDKKKKKSKTLKLSNMHNLAHYFLSSFPLSGKHTYFLFSIFYFLSLPFYRPVSSSQT